MSKLLRFAVAAAIVSGSAQAAFADERVLIFSAYPAEQAVLLSHLQPPPSTPFAIFNGRRFFAGTIAGKSVVMGLVGIGLVNADATSAEAIQYFADHGITAKGIIFSGVAGGPSIGDVVVPDRWTDAAHNLYPVDSNMLAVAGTLAVELNSFLPIEDVTCLGLRLGNTPVQLTVQPTLIVGGLGASADPYGGRKVPCLSHAGSLEGCEACGAPLNTSPGVQKFVMEAIPFLGPQFFLDLFSSFSSGGSSGAIVGDMETAAVARNAELNGIPFLAFRAASDGPKGDPNPVSAAIGFPVQFVIYQQLAADNAAAVVLEFLNQWTP